jgi:ribonuclease HII
MKSLLKRSQPDFTREHAKFGIVCGVDEAGRGPLAGPVFAGCVYIPPEKRRHPVWKEVRDSKQLTPGRRDDLFAVIQTQSCFGIASATVEEIDTINILQATHLAMLRAIETMKNNFSLASLDLILVDGNRSPETPHATQTVIQGDALSVSIAAASILAKVSRDRIMQDLHQQHPAYGWHSNVGYATPDHLAAIETHGFCPHHRKSFEPVKSKIISPEAA